MNNLINANCPVCGNSSKFKTIGKPELSPKAKTVFKETYQVLKCQNCRFYFVSPQNLTDVEMSKLYDETYFTEMTKWWARKRDRDRKNRLDKLQECLNQKRMRFLDIGCGEGYVLIEAADRGWEVHGIDVFDNRMQLAKRQDIKFFKGEIKNAHFPDNHFDCIYMDSVLEHILNPVDYLGNVNNFV
ncbi:class I SAM-dependent methyltransferase [Candidatus Brocadia pituitae]|nr:class I SAM-dependent methyltransferase [Candidatus Brocadia pituitae]